jgi:hypothetical protein
MIEGVLRHDTKMDVEKQYVDTYVTARGGSTSQTPSEEQGVADRGHALEFGFLGGELWRRTLGKGIW